MIPDIGLTHYLTVALALFCTGIYGVLTRRNAMAILMGIELILNAVNINLVAFSKFVSHAGSHPPAGVVLMPEITGQVFAVFVITIAVAEAATGIAIVISLYRNRDMVHVDGLTLLKR